MDIVKCPRCKTRRSRTDFMNKKGRILKACKHCQARNKRYADKRRDRLLKQRKAAVDKTLTDVKAKMAAAGIDKTQLLEMYNTIISNNLWDRL